jgi:hypothetical protein
LADEYVFEMDGRAFEGSDRLDKVAAGLTALQHVFDGQYRAATGKQRLSERDRELFQVRIERYRDGSFIAELGAIYAGLQTALPLFSDAKDLWELLSTTFDFLKAIYGAAHSGARVSIQQDGVGNTTVVTGDTHITYNAPVYQIGTQVIGGVRELDELLDLNEVQRIELRTKRGAQVLSMAADQKGLFFPPMHVDETPQRLVCDIFDFNKYESAGRAQVSHDQPIPPGNYKFKNIGAQAVEDFILSMTKTEVTFNCLIKYQHDPLVESKIAEILVVSVAA